MMKPIIDSPETNMWLAARKNTRAVEPLGGVSPRSLPEIGAARVRIAIKKRVMQTLFLPNRRARIGARITAGRALIRADSWMVPICSVPRPQR